MNTIIANPIVWLAPLFFLVAVLYSSVGFGGGSSYLALLVLAGLPLAQVVPLGLACNIVVTALGVLSFLRSGDLKLCRATPFTLISIPAAYLGGRVPIERTTFLLLLGASLLVASGRLFMRDPKPRQRFFSAGVIPRWTRWGVAPIVGGVLGFFSGMTGIGGGIYLSPLLFLTGWGSAGQIAATASFFILVNSLSGMAGQIAKSGFVMSASVTIPLALAVMVGGWAGSRLATQKFSPLMIRRVTAALILLVSMNLLWRWAQVVGVSS